MKEEALLPVGEGSEETDLLHNISYYKIEPSPCAMCGSDCSSPWQCKKHSTNSFIDPEDMYMNKGNKHWKKATIDATIPVMKRLWRSNKVKKEYKPTHADVTDVLRRLQQEKPKRSRVKGCSSSTNKKKNEPNVSKFINNSFPNQYLDRIQADCQYDDSYYQAFL